MAANQTLQIPHGDGVLPEQPVQWWYWSGHLHNEAGKSLGFQLAFFAGEAIPGLLWGQMAHCAIAEPETNRCSRTGRLWVGAPLRMEGRFALNSPCSTMTALGGDGREKLHLRVASEQLDLDLVAEKPPILHYAGQRHPYLFGGYSYHYSRTSIRAQGTHCDARGKIVAVEGRAWFDRQIGLLSPLLLTGWQWFALQFRDGGSLMVFDFNGDARERFAVYVDARGHTETFAPDLVHIETLGEWRSAKTGVLYPQNWRLRTPKHNLLILPRFADQEMAGWFAPAYWEGCCDVSGTHEGDAYVELVGGVPDALHAPRFGESASRFSAHLAHPVVSLALATAAGTFGRQFSSLRPRFPFASIQQPARKTSNAHNKSDHETSLHRA